MDVLDAHPDFAAVAEQLCAEHDVADEIIDFMEKSPKARTDDVI